MTDAPPAGTGTLVSPARLRIEDVAIAERSASAMAQDKLAWSGVLKSVQPRIRLTRSFEQRHHSYIGYVLHVAGVIDAETRGLVVAVGEAAHTEHQFRIGDRVRGEGVRVADARTEIAELYKVSRLQLLDPGTGLSTVMTPPWHGVPPALPVYRQRGHRRLAAKTYRTSCNSCMWACHMAVELIVDQWNPSRKSYRDETFCYGPLSCALYKAGPTRKVPGRRGMSWEEEDWVDEEETRHRGPDE